MARKSFIGSTVILVASGIVVKLLGFFYRIYLSNLIGAEGMGLFQLISPVYSTVILTLTAGVSIAVSKMTAEEMGRGSRANLRKITKVGLATVIVFAVTVSVIMFLTRDFICNVILKDARTYTSILILIPLIPVIAAASALKGYFYGIQDVFPTAVSQLIEQIAKIGFVMLLAGHFASISLEFACAVAIAGIAAGEITSFLFILIKYKMHSPGRTAGDLRRTGMILGGILAIALPVSANRLITSVMSTIEVILIPRRLAAGGLDYQTSMEEYGKLMGMATPLIYMPAIITASLAVTLVPAISEAIATKSLKTVRHRISKAIKLTFAVGFIFTAIFMTYSDEISSLVYRKEKIGHILYLLAFTCIFVYLQQTLMGIMNGLGKQGILLVNMIIGSLIRIGFVYFVVPGMGIAGYVWGVVLSLGAVCILNLWSVASVAGIKINFADWVVKPGFVFTLLLFVSKYFYYFYDTFPIDRRFKIILSVSTEFGVAALLMLILGIIGKEEVSKLMCLRKQNRK